MNSVRYRQALSCREAEIMGSLCAGEKAYEIAARLSLSKRTVEHHIANARVKLGARTKEHAVALYVEQGVAP